MNNLDLEAIKSLNHFSRSKQVLREYRSEKFDQKVGKFLDTVEVMVVLLMIFLGSMFFIKNVFFIH